MIEFFPGFVIESTLSFKMCKSENHFYKETFVPVQLGRAEVRAT